MCENAYLSIKNPKASKALKQAWDPGRRLLALLRQLRFATSATFSLRSWGPPLTKSWIRTCNGCGHMLFVVTCGHKNHEHLWPATALAMKSEATQRKCTKFILMK